jgi:hypothetical protein
MTDIGVMVGDFTARATDGCASVARAVTAAVASVPAWETAGGLLAAAAWRDSEWTVASEAAAVDVGLDRTAQRPPAG